MIVFERDDFFNEIGAGARNNRSDALRAVTVRRQSGFIRG